MKTKYPKCFACGGSVIEKKIEWDYRRRGKHLIFKNVPVGVCSQCGEKFIRPEISKQMDSAFREPAPSHYLRVPVITFKAA